MSIRKIQEIKTSQKFLQNTTVAMLQFDLPFLPRPLSSILQLNLLLFHPLYHQPVDNRQINLKGWLFRLISELLWLYTTNIRRSRRMRKSHEG